MTKEANGTEKAGGKLRRSLRAHFGSAYTGESTDSVILRGDRSATVYGCRRILCYEPERISLLTGRRTVTVSGRELYCVSFSAGNVTVGGRIASVAYGSIDGADAGKAGSV